MIAAEDLLERESPADIREEAKGFLTTIFEDSEIPDRLRLDAARIMRKAEARKIVLPPAGAEDQCGKLAEIMREPLRKRAQRKAAYERQKRLEAAGFWPAPEGWDADIWSDDWEPPPEPSNGGLAEQLEATRKEMWKGLEEGWYDEPETNK
jgi:hypothetical protein